MTVTPMRIAGQITNISSGSKSHFMPDISPSILPAQFIITSLIGISTAKETMQAMMCYTKVVTKLTDRI